MRIKIEPYNSDWARQFTEIKSELYHLLKGLSPEIEHFGSTAVSGLAAKPVIDVLVGIRNLSQLEPATSAILKNERYLYYQVFDASTPGRRLFVRLKDYVETTEFNKVFPRWEDIPHEAVNKCRLAHVHVWEYRSPDWVRHIAFREYLKAHPEVRSRYENLKKALSRREWVHGMAYNEGKDIFLKAEERKAVAWYLKSG